MTFFELAKSRATAVFVLLGLLAIAGVWAVGRIPSAIFPSVTFPIVKVIADVGEEPAARMMPTVTRPLEEAILRVPGIELVRSTTSRGSSELSAQFAWGTDMKTALQRVEAETQRIRPDLPAETRLDVEWMNTASFPILGYALTSRSLTQAELRALAEYTLKPALVRIPGVSEVQIQGGRQREFEVRLDPQALWGHRLTAPDVVDAIRKDTVVGSAGLAEKNHELYLTLVDGRVHGLDALRSLAVPVKDGPPATLGELGQVVTANEVSYVRTTAANEPAVLLNLVRQPSGNTVAIRDGVDRLFRDHPELLPKGVAWSNFYDQAAFVDASVKGARDAIVIGVLLAAVILFLFLLRLGPTLLAVVSIPLTVAVVGLVLSAFGQTINLMTLAGIAAAIGLIADDAIVVIENIHAETERAGAKGAAWRGFAGIFAALVGSSLSTTVILVPFALLTGVVGAFFKPLALTMALTLAVSFLVAALVIPVAMSLGRHDEERKHKPPSRIARFFAGLGRGSVGFFVRHGWVSVLLLAALFVAAWQLVSRVGTDFLPAMDEGSIILDYWSPPGTSLTDTNAMLVEAEKVISSLPDVETYSRRTGTQLGFFITEPNRGDYVIKLKPRAERRGVDEVIDLLRTRIAEVEPALHTDFGQLLEDNIGDLTGGEPQPIDIKLFGTDEARLEKDAKAMAKAISRVRGVEDVFDGIVIAGPALTVHVDPPAAARAKLTTDDVLAQVKPAVSGSVADTVRVGERIYDLRVFSPPSPSLALLPVRTGTSPSSLVPLGTLATVGTGAPEAEIDREDLKTYIGVTARLSGRDLGGAMIEIKKAIRDHVHLGPGESLAFGGLYQQQQESFRMLLYVLLAGLALVATIVLFEFGELRASFVVVACALASLAGVLAALWVTGTTLNISSFVGAIMMVGIVGENGIFVLNEAKVLMAGGLAAREAWTEAAMRRFRPVAMTVLATALALMPLAVALGSGAQLMHPLAIAVIGGFTLSGFLVLFVLPGLSALLDPRGRMGRK